MNLEEVLQECAYLEGRGNHLIHRTIHSFNTFIRHMMFGWGSFEYKVDEDVRFRDMFDLRGQGMSENALNWGLLYLEYCKYTFVDK